MTAEPLENYGVIGDMRTIAAISDGGSVDWLCWPRFDSPSIFGALLDDDGGSWTVEPSCPVDASRQVYLSGTNVLVTRFHVEGALVEVEDYMPLRHDHDHVGDGGDSGAQHLIRTVRCRRGPVDMVTRLTARPDYGRCESDITEGDDGAVRIAIHDGRELVASGDAAWAVDGDSATGSFTMETGDVKHLALGTSQLDGQRCADLFEDTADQWRRWSDATTYRGRWREPVERSALLLKLLTHRETGGIIAAGTTSLPEIVGGERNWDYRYVWIRDAAFTLYAFIELGHLAEAAKFTEWLVARLDDFEDGDDETPPLAPLYDLDGNADLTEYELDHWKGWRDSGPVRVGNAASGQLQLDIYGELIDALYLADKYGDGLSIATWRHIVAIIDWLGRNWQRPGDGMWEARSGPQRYTSSLLMCWVAVERGVRMAERRGRPAPLGDWRSLRDEMHATLIDRGFNDDLGAFTQVLDGDTVDASILLAPLVKFISPSDPMWLSTLDVIGARLAHGPLVERYNAERTDDGLAGDEGAFTICSFWYVEALARSGRVTEARVLFDRLLSYSSPAGVFSEEVGPDGRMLGNLPQAFTHLALISAAAYLDEALDGSPGEIPGT